MGLFACSLKKSDDLKGLKKDLQKTVDDSKKKSEELFKSMEQGGQPGVIQISGVIVKDDTTTDVRVTVVFKGGIGKDGTQAVVADTKKPTLISNNEKLNLSKVSKQKNLISLGCDGKIVETLAKDRSLEIQQVPAPLADGILIVSAKTIVLCGDMDKIKATSSLAGSLTGQYITFDADELILDQVDYTLVGMNGLLSFNANKLLLLGANQLATKGIDSSMPLPLTPALELNVLKEISSDDNGNVLLQSSGSDYKANQK